MTAFWVLFFYFLPSLQAWSARKSNLLAIFILNLVGGWTIIGWIVALTWSCTKDKKQTPNSYNGEV